MPKKMGTFTETLYEQCHGAYSPRFRTVIKHRRLKIIWEPLVKKAISN